MKHLNEYIKESLLDVDDFDLDDAIKNDIKLFIKANYKGRCSISKNPDADGKYIVDCKGDLNSKRRCDSITNGMFKFGKIGGSFHFEGTPNVTSLEGGPVEVGERCTYFDVGVEDLKWAPKKVNSFTCYSNNLISLKGCPEQVNYFQVCSPKLTTLQDSPKSVELYNCANCPSLTSLEGIPGDVKKLFCDACTSLKSLKGCPEELKSLSIDNCFQFYNMDITKAHFPKKVGYILNGNCGWLGEDIAKVCDFNVCSHANNPLMKNGKWKG